MSNVVTMEITRRDHRLSTVKVFMPVWHRQGQDGSIYIKIPFFGLETYASDESGIEAAIGEAVQCFCIAAEECGLGLESELVYMGWEKSNEGDHLFMSIKSDKLALSSIIDTGDQHALELDLATELDLVC